MHAYELAERFWRSCPCRLGERDRVVVDGQVVSYLLWGHEIARWDRATDVLEVDDCGWRTWLTKNRLNNILIEVGFEVYSDDGRWFICNKSSHESYFWEGNHRIYIKQRRVEPARLRIRRPRISERLRAYYNKAKELVEKSRGMLTVRLLDGTAYVFVDRPYNRRVKTLLIKVSAPKFEVYYGHLCRPTVYSLFLRRTIGKVMNGNALEAVEEDKAEFVRSMLQEMEFDAKLLPGELTSALALAKLVEC